MQFLHTLPSSRADIFESVYSKSVLDRQGRILSVFLNQAEQWHLKSPTPIPNKLKIAALTYEDKRFSKHFGVDILALLRSVKNNFTQTKRTGGSTISMQVIKLYLKPKRTYSNKIKEIFQALALESTYNKDEILAMYLNNTPYGGNIIGYHSASLLYFGKDSTQLTWAESALLAILPNAPGLLNLNKNPQILKNKRDLLLHKLHTLGYFDETILELSLKEPIPQGKKPIQNLAPHLSLKLIQQSTQSNITSTIDKQIQAKLESKIKAYHKKLLSLGILNLSALVVDTKSGEILSYIGSQDFLDIENFGQIDGVVALRSPGSLLKPFLYALSIDEGLIAPQSLLVDVPMFFSNFKPQNANKTFQGLIPAESALQKSLNVPFVRLLQSYGYEKFFFSLQDMAGLKPSNASRYGLSLILGSKEMTMLQIARLYRGLGNYGSFGDLYTTLPYEKKQEKSYITQGSAYLTLHSLKELKREGELDYHKEKMAFSWKSGTSYGRKDAWAAGCSPQYTIVVWAGNFTGKPNPNIFGVKTAGTLLFELLEELPHNNVNFTLPTSKLTYIEADKFSGYRLTEEMKALLPDNATKDATQSILFPLDSRILRISPFYKKVFMYDGKELDSQDENFIYATPQLTLNLPLNVLTYYKLQNVNVEKHLTKQEKTLKIIYPTQNLKIIQPKDFSGQQELIIRIANLKNQNVSWYLDKNLIHSSNSATLKIFLPKGTHYLSIVGEDGGIDSVRFSIEN
ncbi:penicillin-binding protein 1C [Helicobacter cinaedi]|uniref:peptidoglycan glycosyltransferase n=2 Tax=Helicobacter cinaedi TaxID=213 RepID=A0A377JMQ0_9HELI|nr:penicillin-binding protein 1C [Helicobacter cinaedi]